MKIELKFHNSTRFDYVMWRESLGVNEADRSRWEEIFIASLKQHLGLFAGIPPEAVPERSGFYSLQFTDNIVVRYQIIRGIAGRGIVARMKRLVLKSPLKIVIQMWECG